MERLVEVHPTATGGVRSALEQAARELLLLQSSDWPFLVTTGQARDYAVGRFREHVDRFDELTTAVEQAGRISPEVLAGELFERDRVFPDVDYQRFRNREPLRASIAS